MTDGDPLEIRDVGRIGEVAAQLLDGAMNATADPDDDIVDAEVGEVIIVAELQFRDSEGTEYTRSFYRCSDGRKWVQRGLLREGIVATHE